MAMFVSALRWGLSAERKIEGGHATVHIKASSARNRAEAYDNLTLRLPEVKASLKGDPNLFMTCVNAARAPDKVVCKLGLAKHPAFPAV